MTANIEIQNVTKRYGSMTVLDGLVTVDQGQRVPGLPGAVGLRKIDAVAHDCWARKRG